MKLELRYLRPALCPVAVALWSVMVAVPAWAQSYDCDRLRQEIASAGRPDPLRGGQFARAAERQRKELSRTQAYADQIGCSRGFSFFGNPPQCDEIESQVDRMTANLNALEQQISQQGEGDSTRVAALTEQYRAACGANPGDATESDSDTMRPGFANGDDGPSESEGVRRYAKVICVRTCDGGFFPLSFAPAERSTAGLQNLCTALCPNTEVKLYTTPDLDNVGASVSIDGGAYRDLPAAFKYQKSFDASCSCKPPNKSWVEALADAERLLDKSNTKDVTVTAKMSEDMSHPAAPAAPAQAQTRKKGFSKAEIKAVLDAQAAAESALGAVGAQAPTATTDSAGIAADAGASDRVLKSSEGVVTTLPGPGGANRRVRRVGPAL